MEVTFSTFTNVNVKARSYFNDDNDNGIEISVDGDYLGKMVGVSLVIEDEVDEEDFILFVDEVETWIIENE